MKTRLYLSMVFALLTACRLVAQTDAGAAGADAKPAADATAKPATPGAIPPPPAANAAVPVPGASLPTRTNRTAGSRAFPRSVSAPTVAPAGAAPAAALPAPGTTPAVAAPTPATLPAAPAAAVLPGAVPAPAAGNIVPGRVALPSPANATATPALGQLPSVAGQPTPAPAAALPGFNPGTNPDPESSTNIVLLPGGKLKFVAMALDQFLTGVYAKKVGKTILRPATLPAVNISFEQQSPLTDAELLQAYDSVLALNGITTIPTGDKFITVVPNTQAGQEGAAFSNKPRGELPEASQFTTTIIQLKHVKPSEIMQVLAPFAKNANNIVALETTSTLILRDYAINIKRIMEVIEKIDIVVEEDYALEVIPIRYGRVEDIYQTMSGIIGGSGGVGGASTAGIGTGGGLGGQGGTGFGRGGSSSGFGRNSSSSGRYGGNSSGSGYNSGYGGSSGRYGGYNQYSNGIEPVDEPRAGQPGDIRPFQASVTQQPSFQSRLNASRAAGGANAQKQEHSLVDDARIIPDLRSNSLLVYATKKDMEQIKKVVEKVDTLLSQVLIEAIVMNVGLSDNWSLGVSSGQRPRSFNGAVTGGGTANNGDGTSNPLNGGIDFLRGALTSSAANGTINNVYPKSAGFGYSALLGGKWDLAISAVADDSRVDVVQRPRIITSHSVPAEFFVGQEIPYRQGGYSYGGSDSYYYTSLPVGIGIQVTPFITPDSLVVMEISQNIDAVDPEAGGGVSGAPPTTSNRRASSVVTVRSGDVILLGGYLNNNRSKGSAGVPLLKDIPLLGNLFKSSSTKGSKTEMMILVRPTILPKPSDVAAYTEQSRRDSGNIQKLEQDFAEDDRKSKAAAEAERLKAEKKAKAREEKENRKKK